MNVTEQIIALCAEQGVSLAVQDDRLEVVFDEMPAESLLAQLREHKAALIDYLKLHDQQPFLRPITALHETTAPLSFGQKRLWFVDQLEQGSAHYNLPLALELSGELSLDCLKAALDTVLCRHEVLRTTYENSGQRQIIHQTGPMPLRELDWSATTNSASLEQLLIAEQSLAFDLTTEFPIRAVLLKLAAQQHVLLLIVHHIACDGWSLGILVRELVCCYSDLAAARVSSLVSLPVQYADYAYWQQANQDAFEGQLSFWRSHLAQAPALHRLSTDRPRPVQQSFAGASIAQLIPSSLVRQLQQLCQQLEVTPFMLCYAAFALLIARYSDEQDVLIGCPVANRQQGVIEPLIGYFANTVVLRSRLQPAQHFSEWLQQTKTMILDVLQHQEVPFELVVERVQPERNLAYSPLFQLMFAFHSQGKAQLSLPGLALKELNLKTTSVKTDLELAITEVAEGYQLDWNFSTALFDTATISNLADGYQILLQAIVADPAALLRDYPVMTPAAQQQLASWGGVVDTAPLLPSADVSLHGLFTQTMQRQPDAIAVTCADRGLTYRELAQQSDLVAAYLQAQGIVPGQVVAVEMQRTEWLIVALLGVLKAGACYVPLEPDYPQERRDYLRDDSQAVLTLTDTWVRQIVAEKSGRQVFEPSAGGSALAYVLYTSGSTGQPKGVMVSHQSAVHFLKAMKAHLHDSGRWLAVTGVAFDISVLEIFGSLAEGMQIVLWSPDQDLSVAETIALHQITHLQCTPSFAQMHLCQTVTASELQSLQQLYIGGEVFPPQLATQLQQLTSAKLHNMYGPTEATVWASVSVLQAGEPQITLGRPLAGYQLKVMSKHGMLLPPGAAGELYIGGLGVANGYLHRAELTAERFVQCAADSSRWYRTGDLVRWRADGCLQFLGRLDSQVKLRGHRIEPDEIAMQLALHPALQNTAVLLEQPQTSGARLVAYLQPAQWPVLESELITQCKTFLSQKLPSYMIPTVFIVLEKLPLTLNGKLNKAALPASDTRAEQPSRAAQTATEQRLVTIWAELLAVPANKINCESSFFDLGGHSILLTRLLAALQEQFGLRLTIREVFEHASIETLAIIIDQRRQQTGSDTFNQLSRTDIGQTEEFVL